MYHSAEMVELDLQAIQGYVYSLQSCKSGRRKRREDRMAKKKSYKDTASKRRISDRQPSYVSRNFSLRAITLTTFGLW